MTVLKARGSLKALLMGERTALNFLQHLSGIATHVNHFTRQVKNRTIRLVDTRKTTPGLRVLEKYAVKVGGGCNHRTGLFDGVLIKDNHIAVAGGIQNAVKKVRRHISHLIKIEVEATSLSEIQEALDIGVDVIMLDNMDTRQIREAIQLIDKRVLIEISGGINQDNINEKIIEGVDIISIGAFTHSAQSVDLSMAIEPLE